MLLSKLKVKNFLSVNGECELPIDGKVTVLLGANDRGKSNLLKALEHLNHNRPILQEEENWDSKGAKLDFLFQLNESEIARLRQIQEDCNEEYLRVLEEERAASEEEEALAESEDYSQETEEEDTPASSHVSVVTRTLTPLPLNTPADRRLSTLTPAAKPAIPSASTSAGKPVTTVLKEE